MRKVLALALCFGVAFPPSAGAAAAATARARVANAPVTLPVLPPSFSLPKNVDTRPGGKYPQAPSALGTASPALQRLAAEPPIEAPAPGNVDAQRRFAADTFDYKLGASGSGNGSSVADPPGAGQGGSGSGQGGGSSSLLGADDGGGPNYPHRTIRFRGQEFRTVLLRPNVPVEDDIVRAIDAAKYTIHLALFEFKQEEVMAALRRARERKVKIQILLDYSNVFPQKDPGSDYDPRRSYQIWTLLREEFDVKVIRGLGKYGINHNKVAIIDYGRDESLGSFGSYNWSWAAEEAHYENSNFTIEKKRIEALKAAWDWIDGLSQVVTEKSKAADFYWPKQVPPPPDGDWGTVSFHGVTLPSVVFSPDRRPGRSIEEWLVKAIDAEPESISMSIFAVRSTKIAQALIRAKSRGRAVRVVMDESQSKSEPFGVYAAFLAYYGVEVRTLTGPDPTAEFQLAQKLHHKFTVFGKSLVESGSANYTKNAALTNFENSHFLDDATDVAAYAFAFEHLFARGKPFPKPAQAPELPSDEALLQDADQDAPPPVERPPHPGPAEGVSAREVRFNGKGFPQYAFRPDTPIEPMLVDAIDAAKKSIRLSLYEFDLEKVMGALRRAKRKGRKIEIVIDYKHVYTSGRNHKGQPRMPSDNIQALIKEGFDILVLKPKRNGIQHNKYAIFDAEDADRGGGMVEFGSYNWARTAEDNHYENVIFSSRKERVKNFLKYFEYQRGLAESVDEDRLGQVLAGAFAGIESTDSESADVELQPAMADAEPEMAGRAAADFPPPPEDPATPTSLGSEKFQREYFSPKGHILDAWLRAIKAVKESSGLAAFDVAMFSFYSREVAEALADLVKARPDVKVRAALDRGQGTRAKIDGTPVGLWLAQRGVDVRLVAGPNDDGDPMLEKQHNKFMLAVIKAQKFLMTGSFNLSPNAENNSFENENPFGGDEEDANIIAGYQDFFERIFARGWAPRPRKARDGGQTPIKSRRRVELHDPADAEPQAAWSGI